MEGLTYPSESDEPFDLVQWPQVQGRSVGAILASHIVGNRGVKEVDVTDFFSQLEASEDAPRFAQLRRMLEETLEEVRAFRVGEGEVRVDVYLLGHLRQGNAIVGFHTVSVET